MLAESIRQLLRLVINKLRERDQGSYQVRNCRYGTLCELGGDIDDKVSLTPQKFEGVTIFESREAVCDFCGQVVRVEDAWDAIQQRLFTNRPFLIEKEAFEPLRWRQARERGTDTAQSTDGNPDAPLLSSELGVGTLDAIRLALEQSHSGEGYGQQVKAAELAAEVFGEDWLRKKPLTGEGLLIRDALIQIVKDTTPQWHSNHYVIWQRFQASAKQFVERN